MSALFARLCATALSAAALTPAASTAAIAASHGPISAQAQAAPPRCGLRDFCLYEGPQQTGRIVFRAPVMINHDGTVSLVHVENIDPAIHPRSARLPGLPEGLSCVALLYSDPNDTGDSQEIPYGYPLDQEARSELGGTPVRSIDADCG